MQQRDVVVAPRRHNLVVGALLLIGEHRGIVDAAVEVGKTVDFFLVEREDALIDGCFEHRLSHRGAFQQFGFGHFLRLAVLHPVREVEKRQQQRFLLFGASHRVEISVKCDFVVFFGIESDISFCFGPVIIDYAFRYVYGAALEQTAHQRKHIFVARGARYFIYLRAVAVHGIFEHHLFAFAQMVVGGLFPVGVDADKCLALHLQPRGHSCLIHLAYGAQIVVGNPLPKLQLWMSYDGVGVEHLENVLHFIAFGSMVVHLYDYGCVGLFSAKLHKHAAAHAQALLHGGGHTIGERALQCEGHYHFGIHLFCVWHNNRCCVLLAMMGVEWL